MYKMKVKAKETIINGYRKKEGDIIEVQDKQYANRLEYYGIAEFLNKAETQNNFMQQVQVKDYSSKKRDELIRLARMRGLSFSYNARKEELIALLEANDA